MITALVTGSHTRGRKEVIWPLLDEAALKYRFDRLVAGGADYVDTLAVQWAIDRRTSFCVEYAQWGGQGKMAGPVRNERMLRIYKPNVVLAFDGDTGTMNMMAQARAAGIKVEHFGG